MTRKSIPTTWTVWLSVIFVCLGGTSMAAPPPVLKVEAQLLWGTDESQPPEGKDYKPVGTDIANKLKDLPLKWKHYFLVNRKSMEVPPNATKREPVSHTCEVVVKNLGNSSVEVSLIGKGKEVMKRSQKLPKGDILALGGNAPNATAWLVILKRVE